MKKILLSIVLTLCSFFSFGQGLVNDNVTEGSKGSSQNTSVDIKDLVNIDLPTGKMSLNYPIYSYGNSSNGLSHSVSLRYDGSGCKVDAMASDVGLNWSLQYGGSIKRKINGFPDEFNKPNKMGYLGGGSLPLNAGTSISHLNMILSSQFDTEPDLYTYQAGGYSGTFVIGKNGDVIQTEKSNVKIEFIQSLGGDNIYVQCLEHYFRITLPNGTKYKFDIRKPEGLTFWGNPNVYHSIKEWYPSSISSAFGEEYIQINYQFQANEIEFVKNLNFFSAPDANNPPGNSSGLCDNQSARNYTTIKDGWAQIENITYPNGTVIEFIYDLNSRADARDATFGALKEIVVNQLGNNDFGYRLDHLYMVRDGGLASELPFNAQLTLTQSEVNYSLLLSGIKKYAGTNELPSTVFLYNEQNLPERFSESSVDIWGYYNGRNENRILRYYDLTNSLVMSGASRYPDGTKAIAKSLTEILLPTGGSILFEYGSNHVENFNSTTDNNRIHYFHDDGLYPVGGLCLKSILKNDGMNSYNNIVRNFEYGVFNTTTAQSYGRLTDFPVFHYNYEERPGTLSTPYHVMKHCSASLPDDNYIYRSSHPLNFNYTKNGSHVVYSKVIEYLGTPASFKSKVEYQFTTPIDYPNISSPPTTVFPFPINSSRSHLWGKVKNKKIFSESNVLVSEVKYDHSVSTQSYLNDANVMGMKVGLKKYPYGGLNDFGVEYTYPESSKIFNSDIERKNYLDNGVLEAEEHFVYDASKNVLRSIESTDSKGEKVVKKYYYPFDFNVSVSTAISDLNSKDLVYSPISTEIWKGSGATERLISADAVTMKILSNQTIRPDKQYRLNVEQPVPKAIWGNFNNSVLLQQPALMEEKVSFDYYEDSYSNLIQASSKGVASSSISGYNNRKVIAKILNAKVADCYYTSFEDDCGLGRWTESQTTAPVNVALSLGSITGVNTYPLSNNNYIEVDNLDNNRTYTLTFWADGQPEVSSIAVGPQLSSTTVHAITALKQVGNFYLYSVDFGSANVIRIKGISSSNVLLDEVRLVPSESRITTKAYKDGIYVSSTCDANNNLKYLEYDEFGRLTIVRDENENILEKHEFGILDND